VLSTESPGFGEFFRNNLEDEMYDSLLLYATEERSLVKDNMGEERTGRYIPMLSRVFTEGKMQLIHPKKTFNMFDKAYQGDVFELLDEAHGGTIPIR
jgi:hypothetical protein